MTATTATTADDDMGAFWRDVNAARQEKRATNREASPQALTTAGIAFESKNDGAHLIVAGAWDFWPGTGLWIRRQGQKTEGRGVLNLIKRVQKENAA